jgi:predicted phage replisome organizer
MPSHKQWTEIEWFRVATGMFNDEKIRMLDAMPDNDALLVCWVKLLALAAKTNREGYVCIDDGVPYTAEDLAAVWNRPLNTVRLALSTFASQRFQLISVDENGVIFVTNFWKHQNQMGLDRIREQNRLRTQSWRARLKTKALPLGRDGTSDVTTVTSDAGERENREQSTDTENREACDALSLYEQNVGKATGVVLEQLREMVGEYGDEWVRQAFAVMAKANKRSLRYVERVLENWRNGDGGPPKTAAGPSGYRTLRYED